jgi:hypothetical protein
MKDMSLWQLLTSLITDRDEDEAVALPEDGRTTVSLSARGSLLLTYR